jgi:small-conductance mechanosensitive channel
LEHLFGADLSARLGEAEDALHAFFDALTEPSVLIQLAIIVGCVIVGVVLGRVLERVLEPRVRAVHGKPRLLRLLALLLRRTRWIVVVLLLGAAVLVLRQVALPSRSVLLAIAAALLGAWVAISVFSRLIRNRILQRLVAWVAWLAVALSITGTLRPVAQSLDALDINIGEVRISAWLAVKAITLVSLLVWCAVALGNLVERQLARSEDLTPSLRVLIGKLVKIILLVVAATIALAVLGIDLTALGFFSGALGLGIGFGLQKVVSNFVSGIIILLDKSIKPGDTIAIGDTFGWVQSLRARYVEVITRDGREYLIPNEDFITERVENWSFESPLIRIDVSFGVSYDADPHRVRELAVAAAKSVPRVRNEPIPVCHLTAFGASSLDFLLRFWILDPQNGITNVKGAVLLAVWDSFGAAGIEFPLPQRELILRRPVDVRLDGRSGSEEMRGGHKG